MPRIRTVKPAYPKSSKVRSVSRDARLLNIHLWNLADDDGRLQELLQWILGEVFPTDEDVTVAVLRGWLEELERAGLIVRYEVGGERYIQCHDWKDHQRIEKHKPSLFPPPPDPLPEPDSGPVGDSSPDDPVSTGDESPQEEEQGREGEGTATAPTRDPNSPHSQILTALDRVAFTRNVPSPKVGAVEKVCAEFAQHDLAAEVAKFEHYWTDGPGAKRAFEDPGWRWRQWLERVRVNEGRGKQSARSTVASDLAELEAQHAEALREEAAGAAA